MSVSSPTRPMHLQNLRLIQFRNYPECSVDLRPGLTVLVGPNAQGKTNVLEAIFMLVLGKSFRTDNARDLIEHGKDFCRIEGTISSNGEPITDNRRVELVIDGRTDRISKRIKIEGVSHRVTDLIGQFHAVLFVPDDLNVITLSPGYRRDMIDTTLSQVNKNYASTLSKYEKIIRSRNKVLEGIREGTAKKNELHFWDEQLIALAAMIISNRHGLAEYYKSQLPQFYSRIAIHDNRSRQPITDNRLTLNYKCSVEHPKHAEVDFSQKLKSNIDRDIASATTTSGPHREDIELALNGHPLHSFGSRGEQRTTMLALKLTEIEYIKEKTGKTPVLLLDDVFSELDEMRREQLLEIARPEQTIVTTTEKAHLHDKKISVLHIQGGLIRPG